MFCVMFVTAILILFFILGSIKYRPLLWIVRVSQTSVHPLFTISPDNQQYTIVFIVTIIWIMCISFGQNSLFNNPFKR